MTSICSEPIFGLLGFSQARVATRKHFRRCAAQQAALWTRSLRGARCSLLDTDSAELGAGAESAHVRSAARPGASANELHALSSWRLRASLGSYKAVARLNTHTSSSRTHLLPSPLPDRDSPARRSSLARPHRPSYDALRLHFPLRCRGGAAGASTAWCDLRWCCPGCAPCACTTRRCPARAQCRDVAMYHPST